VASLVSSFGMMRSVEGRRSRSRERGYGQGKRRWQNCAPVSGSSHCCCPLDCVRKVNRTDAVTPSSGSCSSSKMPIRTRGAHDYRRPLTGLAGDEARRECHHGPERQSPALRCLACSLPIRWPPVTQERSGRPGMEDPT
jgi:hypothetical protein